MSNLKDRARNNGNAPGTDVATSTAGRGTVAALIEAQKGEIARALPKHMDPDRLARIALTVIKQTPALQRCDTTSLLGALMTCSQLGLEPGPLGEAYLVPYGDKVTFIPGYRGLIKLAWQSGRLLSISADVVHANDDFDYEYGLTPKLRHKPTLTDRGDVIAVYACATFKDGGNAFVVMSRSDVEGIRARSRAGKSGPWVTDWDAMARKGLALTTAIPTSTGWSTMGDVQVGDRLFDMHGLPTTVRAVSEVKNIDCYRVDFANGESVTCDSEHLWVAAIGTNAARDVGRSNWKTHQIADLYAAKQAGKRVTMPVVEPLHTPDAHLPIDPWVLGYWLGDGNRTSPRVSCSTSDQHEVIAAITSAGYRIGSVRKDPRSEAVTVSILGLGKSLADLGLIGHKHVPQQYLRASARQRLALLRGLMDADGHVDEKRGRAHFVNTDPGLSAAVAELARSLGEMVHIGARSVSGYGKTVIAHEVHWLPVSTPVTLSAKARRIRPRQVAPYRGVQSIERVESVPTRCIAVDSPTRTYLAGRDMVPTHNTAVRQLARWLPMSTELQAFQTAAAMDDSIRSDYTAPVEAAQPAWISAEVVEDTHDEPAVDTATGEIQDPPADALPIQEPEGWK